MKIVIREKNQIIEYEANDEISNDALTSLIFGLRQCIINACPDVEEVKPVETNPATERQINFCVALGYKGDVTKLTYESANAFIKEKQSRR